MISRENGLNVFVLMLINLIILAICSGGLHASSEVELSAKLNKGVDNVPSEKSAEQIDVSDLSPELKKHVNNAYIRASEVMEIKNKDNYQVEFVGDEIMIITWPPVQVSNYKSLSVPGADYDCRVEMNKKTGEIHKIQVAR